MSEDGPSIFIDEGWKAQVQREKEEAARKAAAPDTETPKADPTALLEQEDPELDFEQASFSALVGSLATQAMFALGLMADPETGQVMVNLDASRYTLDMLAVLVEKTTGNLSADESQMLLQTTTELEQAFVVRVQQFQEQAMREAGVDPNNLTGA